VAAKRDHFGSPASPSPVPPHSTPLRFHPQSADVYRPPRDRTHRDGFDREAELALWLVNMPSRAVQWSQDLIGFDGNFVGPTSRQRTDASKPERTKTNGDSNQWHCDSFLSACAPH
jgi:hypothetical protein